MFPVQTLQYALILALFFLSVPGLQSQDFIYQPVNSAFGGNALNHGWMLNNANLQNGFEDPAASNRRSRNQLDDFTESLERQILNNISRSLLDFDFGNQGLEEGTYQFGNFQVEVLPGLEGLIVTINDFNTGGSTQITVPYF